MSLSGERPFIPFVLCIVGAGLTLVTEAAHVMSILNNPAAGFGPLIIPVSFALIFGILLALLSVILFVAPGSHSVVGAFIPIISIVSMFQGSNLFALVFCILGGLLAVRWSPEKSHNLSVPEGY